MIKAKTKTDSKNANQALLLATLALVINFWAWTLLSPLGTKYASEFSLEPIMLSFLLAVPIIVGSLGRIILGMLSDKYGGKAIFTAVCFLTAIPTIFLAFADNYLQLVCVAFLLGLGGAVFAVGVPFVSAWFAPERRGFVLGVYSMGNAGTALSGFMTPRLVDAIGQPSTFMLVAGLLVAVGVVFAVYGNNSPDWKPQKGSAFIRLVSACKQRVTWDLSVIYVITFGAFVAFGVYLPVLLKVSYGLSLTDAASRAAGFVLLATLARPVGGWLSDRLGAKSVVRVGLFLTCVLSAFVAFQANLQTHTTVAYLSLAFVLGCCNGAVFALVGKLAKPASMGSTTGIIGAIGGLGGFLPPLILGLTYQQTHSYAMALVMLSLSALMVMVYVHHRFKDKKIYKLV